MTIRSRTKIALAVAVVALLALGLWGRAFALIPDLFRLNKECQEEGYYMAEFEFKMIGIAYLLDKGHYIDASWRLQSFHRQLKNREGLVKVPSFTDPGQEMDFYLGLQNPRTGAFMDDSYPYPTFEGPTGNVLIHLEELSRATGRPLRLNHPLRFLDDINTPEKLSAYLDDITNIGWLAARLPETTFEMARDLLPYSEANNIVERNRLYEFSPEWKTRLLQWFHDNQDAETGYWGPRLRGSGRIAKVDLNNTSSIVKAFVNTSGEDIYPAFPIRYRDRMLQTTLDIMTEAPPAEGDLDEWHAWTLGQAKGIALLTRYLWKGAPAPDKERARTIFESFIRYRFEMYYLPDEGAFRYYPGTGRATLDGTGTAVGSLGDLGYFSAEKRQRVWGHPQGPTFDLGTRNKAELTGGDLNFLKDDGNINSVRFYTAPRDSLEFYEGVAGIFYPDARAVPDVLEIAPKLKAWTETTALSMGNWTSKQDIIADLSEFPATTPPLFRDGIPLEELNRALRQQGRITLVGFDVFQVPVFRITYLAD